MATQESTAVAPVRTAPRSFTEQLIEPFARLRGEVDRLLEEFPARWPSVQFDRILPQLPTPAMEMTETDKAYKISIEVPGMEAKDIEVSVENDMLVVSGEKKEEREEKERDCYRSERSYGAFERRVALPPAAMADKITAKAKDGVLQITIPKDPAAAESNKRRIEIEAAK